MKWPDTIQDLLDSGMTQAQIATACDTGQSHISALLNGKRKHPNWTLGERLLSLRKERMSMSRNNESTGVAESGAAA